MVILVYSISFIAGLILGLFYFGCLWLTISFLSRTKRPALVLLGSFFVRAAIIFFGFYLIMGGHWERLLIALGGFVLVRTLLTRHFRTEKRSLQTR